MGTTAFLIVTDQPVSQKYFGAVKKEPVLPSDFVEIDKVVVLNSPDLVQLLSAIAGDKNQNVLTVSHGTSGGLSLKLAAGTRTTLGFSELNVLNDCANGKLTTAEAAKRLDMPEGAVKALKTAITNVRARKIDRLVLRSCLAGTNLDTLKNLQELFGSKSACGPDVFDTFGELDPGRLSDAKDIEAFAKQPLVKIEGQKPDRFAWSTTGVIGVSITVKAESKQAITDWVARHFPGKYKGSGPIPWHGLTIGNDIVFPLDKGYRDHLKRVP
jgi:hypothetical protein